MDELVRGPSLIAQGVKGPSSKGRIMKGALPEPHPIQYILIRATSHIMYKNNDKTYVINYNVIH